MSKFDTEDLLDGILQIMTDGLNARIAAIDAEKVAKGKTLSAPLAAIASDAYYLQSWSQGILLKNPGIWYGVENIQAVDGGPTAVAETTKVFVEIVMVDDGMTQDVTKKVLRYTRALKEIFSEAFRLGDVQAPIKIETVRPESFKLDYDSSEEIKIGGVSLSISLA